MRFSFVPRDLELLCIHERDDTRTKHAQLWFCRISGISIGKIAVFDLRCVC